MPHWDHGAVQSEYRTPKPLTSERGAASSGETLPTNTMFFSHRVHKPRTMKRWQQPSLPWYSLTVHPYSSGIFPGWSAWWLHVLAWVCTGLPGPQPLLRYLKENKDIRYQTAPVDWHLRTSVFYNVYYFKSLTEDIQSITRDILKEPLQF